MRVSAALFNLHGNGVALANKAAQAAHQLGEHALAALPALGAGLFLGLGAGGIFRLLFLVQTAFAFQHQQRVQQIPIARFQRVARLLIGYVRLRAQLFHHFKMIHL